MTGYYSVNVYIDIDECAINICSNGAACQNTVGHFSCTCPPGFTGARCDIGKKVIYYTQAGNMSEVLFFAFTNCTNAFKSFLGTI